MMRTTYLIHITELTTRQGGDPTGYLKLCEGNTLFVKQRRENATQWVNRRIAIEEAKIVAVRECVAVKVIAWDGTLVKQVKG